MNGFFRRWKQGILSITPLQQLESKRIGYFGQVGGMVLAMVVLGMKGMWYWLPFLGFALVIIIVELIGTHQAVKQLERFNRGS